jgi:hypothetical protein
MKKLFLAVCLCSFAAFANAQVLFGPEMGVNVSNLHSKYPGVSFHNRTSGGFRGGLVLNAFADDQFNLLTGLTYYSFGANLFANQGGQYYAVHLLMHTLQLPLFVHLQSRQGAYGRFFVGVGFAADYHLSGKEFAGDKSTTLNIGNNTLDGFKTFDIAVGADAGYRVINGITIRAQYQAGLSNISNAVGETDNSRSFALTLAYLPMQSKKKPVKSSK